MKPAQKEDITAVAFRIYPDGEVLALFPEIAATVGKPHLCSCYAHIGQHSSAEPSWVVRKTKPATPAESRSLRLELERIGYKLREVKKPGSRGFYLTRLEQC